MGAQALLSAGADPLGGSYGGALSIFFKKKALENKLSEAATESETNAVVSVLRSHGPKRVSKPVRRIIVFSAHRTEIAGTYEVRAASDVPRGFDLICQHHDSDTTSMWKTLNGGELGAWFQHTKNDSYLYYNGHDKSWWIIGGADGLGVYKGVVPSWAPMGMSTAWHALGRTATDQPSLAIFRE